MKQPEILRALEKHRENGYVPLADIAVHDEQLRRVFNLQPRVHSSSLSSKLHKAKIRRIAIHAGLGVYHEQDSIDYLTLLYSSPRRRSRYVSHCSPAKANLQATTEILRNPDYLPLRRACQIAGVAPARVCKWVSYLQILPYWDDAGKCLLYSVAELKTLAPWRQYNTIARLLGHDAAEYIKATRQKKIHRWAGESINLYHVPEISHL